MPNFKSISFKMAVLQGGGQNLPPPDVCVIQKTPCGIGLIGNSEDDRAFRTLHQNLP